MTRPAARPALVVVDDDADALDRIECELQRRFGADYEIVCKSSPRAALAALHSLRETGTSVAVVLADQWMPGLTGEEMLARVRALHPDARRGLLVDFGAWGERATADAILGAMAHGRIDYYVLKPWRSPDELFNRTLAEFVHEWSRTQRSQPKELVVVADTWAPRANELTTLLARNGVPHQFIEINSEDGRALLAGTGRRASEAPLVLLLDGRVLANPSNAELAGAYGVSTELDEGRDFDVAIVGAGPAGLSAAVYAASEGLSTLVVERESIGGQAGSSSLIRNYLGFPRGVGGAELAQRAYQQAWVFGARFVLMRDVAELRVGAGPHVLRLSDGREANARAVVLATGAAYRRLGVPSLEELVGAGVFYGGSLSEPHALTDEPVYVVGGGNSAGQAALGLARHAGRVTIVIRGSSLDDTMSRYLRDEIATTPNVAVRRRTEIADGGGTGRLEWLSLRDRDSGEASREAAAALFVLIGATPRTAWLPAAIARDPSGFVLTGADLSTEHARTGAIDWGPSPFETSVPGVFAVGDTRHGSVKRVASAVGEGSVAVRQIHEYLALVGRPAPARTSARA